MKINPRVMKSFRKLRELGLERASIINLLDVAYTCPLQGHRAKLESELENFHIETDPKRILYGNEFQDRSYAEVGVELSRDFPQKTLYSVVLG